MRNGTRILVATTGSVGLQVGRTGGRVAYPMSMTMLCALLTSTPVAAVWAARPPDFPPPTNEAIKAATDAHEERSTDLYAKRSPDAHGTFRSPSQTLCGPWVSIQVNVDEFGENIWGDAANEPSIAADPSDSNRLVIGWRQFDTVESNFRQAGWGYSHNAGASWTFPGVLESEVFRSDPVLNSDSDGNFYYYSLWHVDSEYHCDLFKSMDGGLNWAGPVSAYGGDKPWMTVDRSGGPSSGVIYAAWHDRANCCGLDTFTRSFDGGTTFNYPVSIPNTPTYGTVAVGPDGEVYVAGIKGGESRDYETFVVAKSTNAQDPLATPTFVTNVVDLGGRMVQEAGPNPDGLTAQVWIAVDHSNGPTRGFLYMLCSVDPPGPDPLDLHFARSTDGGTTWSVPIRINDDPVGGDAWQWFGTLAVAPNGRVDIVWNDTRRARLTQWSELYYAFSQDGGLTWSSNMPISQPFDSFTGWPNQNKLGDYYDMVSDDGGVNVAYAATFNGEQDVYFLRVGDCNQNGVHDGLDIAEGTSADCTGNGIPDECEDDCNNNGIADSCDILGGTSIDCTGNDMPDECEPDCNANGLADSCEILAGTSNDCNGNAIPDECDTSAGTSTDNNGDGVPDECQDCNVNGVPDPIDIALGTSEDCNEDGIPDECESIRNVTLGTFHATIQTAIDYATHGNEIVVAPGTYFEAIDFLGKGVRLRSSHGPTETIIDASGLSTSVVVAENMEGPSTVLDGFTIAGGSGVSKDGFCYGGGLYANETQVRIMNCLFQHNTASGSIGCGGGMAVLGGAPIITNCVFSQNTAYVSGAVYSDSRAEVTVTNCVLTDNSASYEGGPSCLGCSSFSVGNSILWGNTPNEIDDSAGRFCIFHSNIEGGWTGLGTGNIDADPLFVAGPLGCYYLSHVGSGQAVNSPCIDTGSDTAEYFGLDMFTTRRDEIADTGIVDMGFHYPVSGSPLIHGDFDKDGDLDLHDFAEWANYLTSPCLTEPCWPATYTDPCGNIADFDDDGDVDLLDFSSFQQAFGQ